MSAKIWNGSAFADAETPKVFVNGVATDTEGKLWNGSAFADEAWGAFVKELSIGTTYTFQGTTTGKSSTIQAVCLSCNVNTKVAILQSVKGFKEGTYPGASTISVSSLNTNIAKFNITDVTLPTGNGFVINDTANNATKFVALGITNQSTLIYDALKNAAETMGSWIGLDYQHNISAWCCFANGFIDHNYGYDGTHVIAPAFKLNFSNCILINNNTLLAK